MCLTERTMERLYIGREIEMLVKDRLFLITLPLHLRVLPCIALLRTRKCQMKRRYRSWKKTQQLMGQQAKTTTKNARTEWRDSVLKKNCSKQDDRDDDDDDCMTQCVRMNKRELSGCEFISFQLIFVCWKWNIQSRECLDAGKHSALNSLFHTYTSKQIHTIYILYYYNMVCIQI